MSPCQPASARRLHLIAAAIAAAFLPAAAQAADFFWSTGDFVTGVTAPEPLLFGDTLFIQAGGAKRFVGSTFTNEGLVRWQSDSLQGGNSASVMNSGTWQSESDTNTMIWGFGGRPTFTNSGTYAKTAGTTTNVGSWAFVNAGGLIDAQVGTIVFNGDANTFNAGSRFSGAGQVAITGGSTFNGSFTADNLVFAGGANNGTGAILSGGVASAGGNAGWTGGDFSGSWTIAAGSTMTASGAAGKRQVGSAIDNKGKFVWDTTATLQGGNSSTFTNNGQTEVRQSATFEWNFGGQAAFVNNAGASVLATNNATLTFGNLVLTGNGGSFVADAGSAIVFNGGSNRFNDGTQFTGDIRAQGTSTYVGNISSSGLRWTGGTQLGGDGSPGSKAELSGTVGWEGGDLQRSFVIGAASTVTASGATTKRQVGSAIENKGKFVWDTTATLQGGNSSTFTNNGQTEVRQSASFEWNFGGQAAFVNNNAGASVLATNNATLTFGNLALTGNGGSFVADAGSAIVFNGGSNRFNDGTQFTGDIRAQGTSTYVGNISSSGLRWTGGTQLGGDGSPGSKAELSGTVGWEGGDLQRSFVIGAASTVTASGATTKRQVGSAIENKGKFVWDTTATLQGGNSSTFTNNGKTEVRQSASFEWNFGGQAAFVNNNAGASVLATNNATLTFGNLVLTGNGGSFVADAGSAIVFNGGSNRFNDGTQFTGDIRAQGTSTYVGNISTSGLRWTGGTQFGGDGTPGSQAVLAGTVSWEDGDVQRNFVIGAASTMTASGAASKRQVGSAIDNKGKFIWDTTATLQGGNSSSFVNNGSFDMRTDADLTWNFGGQASLTNIGVFVKSAGIGTTSLSGLALSNTGTMDVQSGAIELPTNFVNAGTMMGTGAFALSGTLTNNGHVAPGASPGTLTISGSFAQSALGTLDTELENLSSVDLLLIDGNASLAGTLALSCFASCDFAVGDEVVILDATGNLSGSFGSVTLAGFGSGAFDVVYDLAADRVLLRITETVTPAIPEPGTIALMLAGLGMVVAAARRRRG